MKSIYSSISLKNAELKYDGIMLMEKAARGILSHLKPFLDGRKLVILCGKGNNGGDGWAVASLLENYPVIVIYTDVPKTKEALHYYNLYKGSAISIHRNEAFEIIKDAKIILDCIFGIGLTASPKGIFEAIFSAVNQSEAFVVSADVPSGISSDNTKYNVCIKADLTLCITSPKLSCATTPTKEFYGEVKTIDIGVDMSSFHPDGLISDESALTILPKRKENSHKGTYGTLKTLCGSYNMPGAGILAINSSLRCGVGLVKVFGDEKTLDIYKHRLTEPVFCNYSKEDFIQSKSTAALIGCGIGNTYQEDLFEILQNLNCPTVIDADGLNFIAKHKNDFYKKLKNCILTPHPLELSRLLDESTSFINENRLEACERASMEFDCTVVLKGNGTVICSPNETPVFNSTGNSGLAKGGSGDVLAGVIASFLAQGANTHNAAVVGTYLHGCSADRLEKRLSAYSFLPSDIPFEIGHILAENKGFLK